MVSFERGIFRLQSCGPFETHRSHGCGLYSSGAAFTWRKQWISRTVKRCFESLARKITSRDKSWVHLLSSCAICKQKIQYFKLFFNFFFVGSLRYDPPNFFNEFQVAGGWEGNDSAYYGMWPGEVCSTTNFLKWKMVAVQLPWAAMYYRPKEFTDHGISVNAKYPSSF